MKQLIHRRMRIARYVIYRETIVNKSDLWWSFIGAFAGITCIGLLNSVFLNASDTLFLIGSFGASAILIYGSTNSPLAQPRNLIGGHLISAFIGVSLHMLLHRFGYDWLTAGLSVSLSLVAMQITKTVHPPGGATALIVTIGSEKIRNLGYMYIISPVLSGVLILLVIALFINNIPSGRSYPYKK